MSYPSNKRNRVRQCHWRKKVSYYYPLNTCQHLGHASLMILFRLHTSLFLNFVKFVPCVRVASWLAAHDNLISLSPQPQRVLYENCSSINTSFNIARHVHISWDANEENIMCSIIFSITDHSRLTVFVREQIRLAVLVWQKACMIQCCKIVVWCCTMLYDPML